MIWRDCGRKRQTNCGSIGALNKLSSRPDKLVVFLSTRSPVDSALQIGPGDTEKAAADCTHLPICPFLGGKKCETPSTCWPQVTPIPLQLQLQSVSTARHLPSPILAVGDKMGTTKWVDSAGVLITFFDIFSFLLVSTKVLLWDRFVELKVHLHQLVERLN